MEVIKQEELRDTPQPVASIDRTVYPIGLRAKASECQKTSSCPHLIECLSNFALKEPTDTIKIESLVPDIEAICDKTSDYDEVLAAVHFREDLAWLIDMSVRLGLRRSPDVTRAKSSDERRMAEMLHKMLDVPAVVEMITRLSRRNITKILDLLQELSDMSGPFQYLAEHPDNVRDLCRSTRRALVRISTATTISPSSLYLTQVTIVSPRPVVYGGFADIFIGSYDSERVAVKRLRRFTDTSGAQDDKLLRGLIKEAVPWRQLKHPNIAAFLGIVMDTSSSTPSIVAPWMQKGNMRDYLREHREPATIIRLLCEVADGMAYLHGEGVVHGDLRGTNILVDDEDHCRITDFGLATLMDLATDSPSPVASGPIRWCAPELFWDADGLPVNNGHIPHTKYSDIYSFGCVCLEAYTLNCPFSDVRLDAQVLLLLRQRKTPPRPSQDGVGSLPDHVWEIAQSCWSGRPDDRPAMVRLHARLMMIHEEPRMALPMRMEPRTSCTLGSGSSPCNASMSCGAAEPHLQAPLNDIRQASSLLSCSNTTLVVPASAQEHHDQLSRDRFAPALLQEMTAPSFSDNHASTLFEFIYSESAHASPSPVAVAALHGWLARLITNHHPLQERDIGILNQLLQHQFEGLHWYIDGILVLVQTSLAMPCAANYLSQVASLVISIGEEYPDAFDAKESSIILGFIDSVVMGALQGLDDWSDEIGTLEYAMVELLRLGSHRLVSYATAIRQLALRNTTYDTRCWSHSVLIWLLDCSATNLPPNFNAIQVLRELLSFFCRPLQENEDRRADLYLAQRLSPRFYDHIAFQLCHCTTEIVQAVCYLIANDYGRASDVVHLLLEILCDHGLSNVRPWVTDILISTILPELIKVLESWSVIDNPSAYASLGVIAELTKQAINPFAGNIIRILERGIKYGRCINNNGLLAKVVDVFSTLLSSCSMDLSSATLTFLCATDAITDGRRLHTLAKSISDIVTGSWLDDHAWNVAARILLRIDDSTTSWSRSLTYAPLRRGFVRLLFEAGRRIRSDCFPPHSIDIKLLDGILEHFSKHMPTKANSEGVTISDEDVDVDRELRAMLVRMAQNAWWYAKLKHAGLLADKYEDLYNVSSV